MRGIPDLNKPSFMLAEKLLAEKGFSVWNPAKHEDYFNSTFKNCISADIRAIMDQCRKIAFLPGWRKSLGANIEGFVAFAMNMEAVEIIMNEQQTNYDFMPVDLNRYILPYSLGEMKDFNPHLVDISFSPD